MINFGTQRLQINMRVHDSKAWKKAQFNKLTDTEVFELNEEQVMIVLIKYELCLHIHKRLNGYTLMRKVHSVYRQE